MKIYLSGKITGTTDYMERFAAKQKDLELKGYEVINPALINSYLPKSTTWKEYMSLCHPMIDMCEAIYFLNGWENSKGAKIEFDYAMNKKKVMCFETENRGLEIRY